MTKETLNNYEQKVKYMLYASAGFVGADDKLKQWERRRSLLHGIKESISINGFISESLKDLIISMYSRFPEL